MFKFYIASERYLIYFYRIFCIMEIYHPKTLYPPPKYQSSNPFHQTIAPHFAWKQKPKQHISFLWGGGGQLLNPKKTTKTTFFAQSNHQTSKVFMIIEPRPVMPAITSQNLWSLGVGCWVAKGGKQQCIFSQGFDVYIYIPRTSLSSILVVVSPSKTRPKLQSKQGPPFGF